MSKKEISDFVMQPIHKRLNRANIISRVEKLEEGEVDPLPSARVDGLGEMAKSTGSLVVDELIVINHDAGVGDIILNQYGILFRNQEGELIFQDTAGGSTIALYSDAANFLVLANQFGGAGITFLLDDAGHVVKQIDFDADGNINLFDGTYKIAGVEVVTSERIGRSEAELESAVTSSVFVTTGWTSVTDWTRTGNHTFTKSGDTTVAYRKGTKVRYKDGGAFEYGVIASSSYSNPTTTITLITNTDYAMAAATITDTYISYIENPEGFPHWFNWDAAPTGFSAVPTTVSYKWTVYGRTITLSYVEGVNGTSNAITFTATAPVLPLTAYAIPLGLAVDNTVQLTTPGRITLAAGSATITLRKDTANAAWTNSGGKRAIGIVTYEF